MPKYTVDGNSHDFKVTDRLNARNGIDNGATDLCHSILVLFYW
jgi:hypothetical protein